MAGLEQEIRKWLKTGDKPKDISTMIDRKYALLRTTYGINFDPIVMSLRKSPDIYSQIDNLSNLKLFFRRPIDIALSLADQTEDLWCKDKNCWLTVARLSVPNTHAALGR